MGGDATVVQQRELLAPPVLEEILVASKRAVIVPAAAAAADNGDADTMIGRVQEHTHQLMAVDAKQPSAAAVSASAAGGTQWSSGQLVAVGETVVEAQRKVMAHTGAVAAVAIAVSAVGLGVMDTLSAFMIDDCWITRSRTAPLVQAQAAIAACSYPSGPGLLVLAQWAHC